MTLADSSLFRLENYKVNSCVVSRSIQGEEVIMDLDSGMYFGLNEIGSKVWNSLKQRKSTESFISEVGAEFDVDRSTLIKDVRSVLKLMTEKKLIITN